MMFGLGESFDYVECSKCGCLQIKEIPKDISKYYRNENYYSFEKSNKISLIKKLLINKRNEYCIFKGNFLGKIINSKYPNYFFSLLGDLNIRSNSKILDVGCGAGNFLFQLKELNFKDLTGIDLYLEKEIYAKNFKILKKSIHQLPDNHKFDLIIFSHSFEHMKDPFETLTKVKSILSKNGTCIIRIPVKTDYIWNQYGVNWVQIDAPRHFFVYTLKSFNFLLNKTGFELQNVIFDSTEFQFWGSEQYKNNIPLKSSDSYAVNPAKAMIKPKINQYKKDSKKLNKNNLGDQATFILKHVLCKVD